MNKERIILLTALFLFSLFGTAFAQSEDEALRLHKQGLVAYEGGYWGDALFCFEKSLEIYRSLNRLEGYINLINIGMVYNSLGQYQESLKYYEEAGLNGL
ncbi:MAG: tetratricopeptide repeat protein [Nitrospirae bacterium]|nr:tetratricopeptide repeat protein [Nitrospirota bacterium]